MKKFIHLGNNVSITFRSEKISENEDCSYKMVSIYCYKNNDAERIFKELTDLRDHGDCKDEGIRVSKFYNRIYIMINDNNWFVSTTCDEDGDISLMICECVMNGIMVY